MVNGKDKDFNIGCRTFLYVNQLVSLFPQDPSKTVSVNLNGCPVMKRDFYSTIVNSGDKIEFN
jgi:sulfur carrier protein ThiS